jgi:hypothetical protein
MVTATEGGPLPPLERWQGDPWGSLGELATQLVGVAAGWGLRLLLVVVPLWLAGVAAARGWRRWRQQRLAAGARLIQVLPPPQVEPAAAEALWGNVAGLLRLRRPLDPRPHVSFELTWTTRGVSIGLWVPGTVAPRLVERAVEAGWPGARTSTHPASPVPLTDGMALAGGELRLAAGPWQPLRTEHWVDPLRAVLGAAGELAEGETATVQVLARPAGGRRLVRAQRAAHALAGVTGPRARLVGGLLDLLTPGGGRGPRRLVGPADPRAALAARAAVAKLAGPCWEVRVRYGVSGSAGLQGRLRARAHALAAAYAVYSGRNRLTRRRLWRPARTLAARSLHHSDLLAAGELAALAHLPIDPAVPGLARAGARTGQRVRAPASLYVDECQNFLTLPYRFEELLPEACGYGLALHLAHQHLGQLPRELHDALSANARTKVYFTVSPEDARALERHVHPSCRPMTCRIWVATRPPCGWSPAAASFRPAPSGPAPAPP